MNRGLLELLREEKWSPGGIEALVLGMEKAIRKSMILEPPRIASKSAEEKRRIDLCLDLYRIMSNDLNWSARRAADRLEVYLLKKIRGEEIVFETRGSWIVKPD